MDSEQRTRKMAMAQALIHVLTDCPSEAGGDMGQACPKCEQEARAMLATHVAADASSA